MSFGPNNAIAFLQIRLRGGLKNFATTSGVYALALVSLIGASTRMDIHTTVATACRTWLPILLGIEGLLLFLFAGTRVTAAIRFDLNTRMIESHRLMPTTGASAIWGYIVGATSQALVLFGVTLAIGVFCAGFASIPMVDWLLSSAVLAAFCASLWGVLAYLAFGFRTPFLWVMAIPVLSMFIEGAAWVFLPGLALYSSPLIGRSIFDIGIVGGSQSSVYLTSAVVQAAIGGICFIAATRRYTRDDGIGLGPGLGLALLAVAAAATWSGIGWWDDFRPVWFRNRRFGTEWVQLVASLIMLTLIALIPITSAARIHHARLLKHPAAANWRSAPVLVVVLLAAAILAGVPSALLYIPDDWRRAGETSYTLDLIRDPWLGTALLLLFALAAFSFAVGIGLRRGGSPVISGIVWLGVAWIGPILADVIREAASTSSRYGGEPFGLIANYSPVGALGTFWREATWQTIRNAVIAQGLIALAMGLIHLLTPARQARPALASVPAGSDAAGSDAPGSAAAGSQTATTPAAR